MNAKPLSRDQRRMDLIDTLEQMMETTHLDSLHQLSERLRPFNLTISQYLALVFVARQERPSTLSEIGTHIDAPPSSMTSIVDRMVGLGLVVREQHPDDRRSFRVSATAEGNKLLEDLQQLRREDFEFILEGIANEELEQLSALFGHVQERVAILLHESRHRKTSA